MILLFFIFVSLLTSYIDLKRGLILDKIIIPAFFILVALKYFENNLGLYDLIAVLIVLVIFIIPIVLNMAFGGGDLRFGAFCALFVGLGGIGFFIMLSGLIHFVLLKLVKKESFAFAPAMSIAALGTYIMEMI